MAANQTQCSRLKQRSAIKFLEAEKCKQCEIYIKRLMSIERHVLVKKIIPDKLNMSLPLWAWVKKTICGVETHRLSHKEKVLGAVVSKEGHAESLLGHEWTHDNWFPWKMQLQMVLPIAKSFGKIHLSNIKI